MGNTPEMRPTLFYLPSEVAISIGNQKMSKYRDSVIKREQAAMRELINEAGDDGVMPEERAMAMFIEADTYGDIILAVPRSGRV